MIKFYKSIFLLLFISTSALGQDIHYSQFFNTPGLVNPAQAGQYRLTWRSMINFRNQWSSIPAPYSTPMVYADASLFNCKLKGDHMGAGVTFVNDRSGNGALNVFQTKVAVAYHKALDKGLKNQISVGFQGDYTRKNLDFTKLTFQSQYSDYDFDPALASNENITNTSFQYIDLNAGLLFTSMLNKNSSVYVGGAIHHLTQPKEGFLNNGGKKLGMKMVGHAAGQIMLGDKFNISPGVYYATQSGAQEIMIGTAMGYNFTVNNGRENYSAFYAGVWYRLQDAFIIFTGIDYKKIRFSFSYDVNNSSLKTASFKNGGFELSLGYVGFFKDCRKKYNTIFCPRF